MATLHEGDIPGISSNGAAFLAQLGDELTQLRASHNQLLADHNSHTHGGITTGAGTSGAPTAASTAVPVTTSDSADPQL